MIELAVEGTDMQFSSSYDLKNPCFRYMGSPSAVPGIHHSNPTDSYFENLTPASSTDGSNAPSVASVAAKTLVTSPPSNVVNSGSLLQSSLEHMDPTVPPYQQQTLTTSGSSSDPVMYAVSSGVGGMYKYQPYHTVASGNSTYQPPYTVANGYS